MSIDSPAIGQRLICALDLPEPAAAQKLVQDLGDIVCFYKIGMELCTHREGLALIDWLQKKDKNVFVDLKFLDIPRSVAAAVQQLNRVGACFCTVHDGGDAMLEAAVAVRGDMKILLVTALSSHDSEELRKLGLRDSPEQIVRKRAERAVRAGCDGVIVSGQETASVHREFAELMIVTPGIRTGNPVDNDDQKRVSSATAAIANGADYIVVGRPILRAEDPAAAAAGLQREIAQALQKRGSGQGI